MTMKKMLQIKTMASIYAQSKDEFEAVEKITFFLMNTYGANEIKAQKDAIKIIKMIRKIKKGE